jgi:outer membrane biosynthesis protein TonB
MTERQALIGVAFAHLLLFGLLSLSWQLAYRDLPQFAEAVPVELVNVAEVTQVTAPPKPSIKAAPQESAAPPPTPTPPEPKPPEPVAPPKPEAVKPPPPPKVAPEPVKQPAARLDAEELSNLIDKSLPKAKTKPRDTADFAKTMETAIPKSARLDAHATASLEQAIRAQIAPCWNPPIGGADVKKMTVVLHIELARDGTVIGRPTVVSQTGTTTGNADYARAFAETARRAVLRCAPIKLPADMYDAWKAFELNFDPSEMT